jgi:hypothetical protein
MYVEESDFCLFREICEDVVTVEKEIARKEAEEILKKEEERQKLIDINAAEVCAMDNAEVFKKSYFVICVNALGPNFQYLAVNILQTYVWYYLVLFYLCNSITDMR